MKSQDILLVLKVAITPPDWSYRSLASDLFISVAEAHQGLQRASESNLVDLQQKRAKRQNLLEFLFHGLKYVFPARAGAIVRGMPTSFGASPLAGYFGNSDILPVWSDPSGTMRGYEIVPLFNSVPEACKRDSDLYEILALTDALREGRARERKIAEEILQMRLGLENEL